jgi:hypothetical protein
MAGVKSVLNYFLKFVIIGYVRKRIRFGSKEGTERSQGQKHYLGKYIQV